MKWWQAVKFIIIFIIIVIFLFFHQVFGSRWLMVDTEQVYYGMPHRMVTWCKSQYRRMKRKSGVMSCRALCAVQQGLHCSLLSLHTWPEVIRGHGAVDIRESRPLYKEMPIAPSVQWAPYMEPVASNYELILEMSPCWRDILVFWLHLPPLIWSKRIANQTRPAQTSCFSPLIEQSRICSFRLERTG